MEHPQEQQQQSEGNLSNDDNSPQSAVDNSVNGSINTDAAPTTSEAIPIEKSDASEAEQQQNISIDSPPATTTPQRIDRVRSPVAARLEQEERRRFSLNRETSESVKELVNQQFDNMYVQLIDGEGKFTDELNVFIERYGLQHLGLNYSLIAVFGCQSSGKSTLLNLLFGTHFPTMNSRLGRYQTTRGVCVSKDVQSNILVFDVEGTDSKERGEENMSFERKLSLFALAMTEVLIVNMWMQDIGRYHASNYYLLKTVMELNLQLFQKERSSKTLLLFVIRDHYETPLETLEEMINQDIRNIWASLSKPDGFEESTANDFFDFGYTCLPHKIHAKAEFEQKVADLSLRFHDTEHPDYIFKPIYKKGVPLDGFQHYATTIWETIQSNRDLDLPTQKEMLALYRCNEISRECYAEFEVVCETWKATLKGKKYVKTLGKVASKIVTEVLEKFDAAAHLYLQSVVETKHRELEQKMKHEVRSVFDAQINLCKTNAVRAYEQLLNSLLKRSPLVFNFIEETGKLKEQVMLFFNEEVQSSSYPGEEWDVQTYQSALEEDITRITEEARESQLEKLIEAEKDSLTNELTTAITPLINSATADMWQRLRILIDTILKAKSETLRTNMSGYAPSEEEITAVIDIMRVMTNDITRQKVVDGANFLSMKMRNAFDNRFRYSEDRLPRIWNRNANVRRHFIEARTSALKLLDTFFIFRLNDKALDSVHLKIASGNESVESSSSASPSPLEDGIGFEYPKVDESVVILNADKCQQLYEKFLLETDNAYSEALRIQMLDAKNQSIPWWMYALLVFFAWDEIAALLSRPFLLMGLLVIAGFVAYHYFQAQIIDYLRNGNPTYTVPIRMMLEKLPIQIINLGALNTGEGGDNRSGSVSAAESSIPSSSGAAGASSSTMRKRYAPAPSEESAQ